MNSSLCFKAFLLRVLICSFQVGESKSKPLVNALKNGMMNEPNTPTAITIIIYVGSIAAI